MDINFNSNMPINYSNLDASLAYDVNQARLLTPLDAISKALMFGVSSQDLIRELQMLCPGGWSLSSSLQALNDGSIGDQYMYSDYNAYFQWISPEAQNDFTKLCQDLQNGDVYALSKDLTGPNISTIQQNFLQPFFQEYPGPYPGPIPPS